MTIYLSGSIWLWCLRFVALCMTLILIFHVAVPEIVLGVAWALLFLFSFVVISGQASPPA